MKQLYRLISIALILAAIHTSMSSQNWLSTNGNKLEDANGNTVRLTGVNWFGFETGNLFPHGIWTRDTYSMLQHIKNEGFNCIRLPWCNTMLEPSASIKVVSYEKTDPIFGKIFINKDLEHITKPIELMDAIVRWCQNNDMKIILDNHSRQNDGYMVEGLWYTDKTSEAQWLTDWRFMTDRYKNYDAVVAMDLNNEPHGKEAGKGATWGNSNPLTDWNKAAERCGNAILAINPNVLIMVEGVEATSEGNYWWGGNLTGVKTHPIVLNTPNKLVYSPHEYGPTVHLQPWFEEATFPNNMEAIWDKNFNFIYKNNTAPLLIGEFGIRDQDGKDAIWLDTFLEFMGTKYSWTFWCWNPNSGDTGGLVKDDWETTVDWKLNLIKPYMAPLIPNGKAPVLPTDVNTLKSENSTTAIPNPFSNELTLHLKNPSTVKAIRIYDQLGSLTATYNYEFTNEMTIGRNLQSGLYIVNIESLENSETLLIRKL